MQTWPRPSKKCKKTGARCICNGLLFLRPKPPLPKGRRAAAVNAHGSFLRFVTSLTRPPGCPRWQCARWLSANRYFPDLPGIGGESPQTISHGNLQQIVTAPPMPGIVTAVEVGVSITFIKYHPKIKPSAYPPLAPSVTATPCQLPPGGSYGLVPFYMGLCLWESANCESLSHGEGHRGLPGRVSSLWQGSLQSPPCQRGVVWR